MGKTSISAGEIVRGILLEDPAVQAVTRHVFPVATDEAALPYILYRRRALSVTPQKSGQPGTDEIQMEVCCLAATYAESVALAEAARAALDFAQGEAGGLRMRSCTLAGASEDWAADAYVQQLIFKIKI